MTEIRAVTAGPGDLASNEAVLPPSASTVAAMAAALGAVHRYPDGSASGLRQAVGVRLGVPAERVVVGHGSEDVIRLLLAAVVRGGSVALADPACEVHERILRAVGSRAEHRPLRDHRHDLGALAECATDAVLICNPHNPTGTSVLRRDIEAFLPRRRAGLVVVDEAYVDFTDAPDATTCAPLAATRDDVVVVRTLSKVYGLAAVRVGYLVAPPPIAAAVRAVATPFPVNGIAQAAGVAALADREHHAEVRDRTRRLRAAVTRAFRRAGFDVVPSQANFVLVLAPDERALERTLLAGGVRVRAGRSIGVPGSLRVTVPDDDGLRLVERALAGG